MSQVFTHTSTVADGNMSLKLGDTLEVIANRNRFLTKHDGAWDRHICMRCDHGTSIVAVGADTIVDSYRMFEAEVLVTTDPDLTLMLLTADCLPVTFFDPTRSVLALAHFSRQTIATDLPTNTVAFLQQNNDVATTDLQITIGPHIHSESYCFPLPLEHRDEAIAPFIIDRDGYTYVDLTAAAITQLTAAGVPTDSITIDPANTGADDNYFSYYRAKHAGRTDGRIVTIAHFH